METINAPVTFKPSGFKHQVNHTGNQGTKKHFKKKPSPEERYAQSEMSLPKQEIHATGYVSIHPDLKGDGIVFRGLYVPGVSKDRAERFPAHLRNRIIILGKAAPAWVVDFCKQVIKDKENLMIRVNVTRLIDQNLCIAYPCAKSAPQARAEWRRKQGNHIFNDPRTIHDCRNYWTAACFVHSHVAKSKGLTVLKHASVESARPYSSLAVGESGAYFTITGGDEVYNFEAGIANGATTLEKEIARIVKINRHFGNEQAAVVLA